MKIAFYTFGCKVNQYETEALKKLFLNEGWEIVEWEEGADGYVINSCTVTSTGDKKVRQMLHRIRKQHPASIIAVTGCFPQAFPTRHPDLKEADIITGSSCRSNLPALFRQHQEQRKKIVAITPFREKECFDDTTISGFSQHSRAFVKIQDGCENHCTYCIIPTARGPSRSKPLELVRSEVEQLAENGYREIVLVGINLSAYGRDLHEGNLVDAVRAAASVPKIKRIRLGSLEPEALSVRRICLLSEISKFCPQFHISLQSGSDSVLRRMNRRYSTRDYAKIVAAIRKHFDNPTITTDIMIGFPGETEEEFTQSVQFVAQMGFTKAHIFPYSIRPNTPAAKMPDQLSKSQKHSRSKIMTDTVRQTQQTFLDQQVGSVHEVLFETQKGATAIGYTKNYLPVYVKTKENLTGSIYHVKIVAVKQDSCRGKLLKEIVD